MNRKEVRMKKEKKKLKLIFPIGKRKKWHL